ncbi:MAG: radical SAM protein [Elusimicrobia bacterium]|nr:radical SAM protein [Elusimicrobiota bacterium]
MNSEKNISVCLLTPYSGEREYELCDPILGLTYLSSSLSKNNINNCIVDTRAGKLNVSEAVKSVIKYNPEIVGISCTTNQFPNGLMIAEQLKSIRPEIMIVFGGPHVSALPDELIKHKFIDYIIQGEGEYSFINLVKHILADEKLNEGGIYFKKDNILQSTGPAKLIEKLDNIPFPDFSKLDIKTYFKRQKMFAHTKRVPYLSIITSRGCPGKCVFCSKAVYKQRCCMRSPENMIEEIERDIKDYKVKEIRIYDDCFTLSKSRVIEFCKLAVKKKLDVSFALPNGIRIDQVDKEMLEYMRAAGFYMLFFGVESGDQKVLDIINKGIKIEEIKQAVKLCKKMGFYTCMYLVVGLPGSSSESEKMSLKLLKELNPNFIGVSMVTPYPGSELYNEMMRNKKSLQKSWNTYKHDYTSNKGDLLYIPAGMTQDEVIYWYKKMYRDFYLRPAFWFNQFRNISWLPRRFCFFTSSAYRRFFKGF